MDGVAFQAGQHVTARWPNEGLQAFNYISLLLGQTVLSWLIGNRWRNISNTLRRAETGRPAWWAQLWLSLVFILSLVFLIAAGLVTFGIGTARFHSCEAAILICIVSYGSAKLALYLFLAERAFIVSGYIGPKIRSKLYMFNLIVISLGPVLVVLNIVGRISSLDDHMGCHIGLNMEFSLPFITWDAMITLWFTLLFLRPILASHLAVNPRLRRLAIVSCICAIAALATSVANLTVLIVLRQELTFICLSTCPLDICVNALILAATTNPSRDLSSASASAPQCTDTEKNAAVAPQSTGVGDTASKAADADPDAINVLTFLGQSQQRTDASEKSPLSTSSLSTSRRLSWFGGEKAASAEPWDLVKLTPVEEAALRAPVPEEVASMPVVPKWGRAETS